MGSFGQQVRAVLDLLRLPNAPTVWSNVVAAWILSGGDPLAWQLPVLCLGGTLLYFGGTILNDAFDADWDARHRPERPIPSGRLARSTVWGLGYGGLGFGSIALLIGGCHGWLITALTATIVAYDWLHKKTAWSVTLMGGCRTLLYLVVGIPWPESNKEMLDAQWPNPALFGGLLGIYIISLSLFARGEATGRKGSGIWILGLLPAPLLILLILQKPPSLWVPGTKTSEWIDLLPGLLALAMALWCVAAVRLPLRPGSKPADIGRCVSRLLAGIVLFDAMLVSVVHPTAGLALLILFPLALLLQKKFAAT
ncbi:MAG: UbiA family prenyltransferase [Opitutales bacterium]